MRSLLTPLLLSALGAFAQIPPNYRLEKDWLLDSTPFQAAITENRDAGTVTFGNGLFSRTIDTRLGTTVRYENLMTGEAIIRAVEPEGSVTIDGNLYLIGGAEGQPNKAYLTEEWRAKLTPPKNALELVGVETGEPAERLEWKRVRHHAPDAVWPPGGKTLRLDYRIRAPKADESPELGTLESEAGRKVILADSFGQARLDPSWAVHATKAFESAGFQNEGKPGEIYTLPNTAVYAERPIPEGTALVEAEINTGTDGTSSWGPGIGIVYSSGKVVKFHLRPGGLAGVERPVLGLYDGINEVPNISGDERIDTGSAVSLRVRFSGDTVMLDARQSARNWKHYRAVTIPGGYGRPVAFRVGKMAKDGGPGDHSAAGEPVRLRVNRVGFFSEVDTQLASALKEKRPQQDDIAVSVHFEIYDGIPAFSKWITVKNESGRAINLDRFNAETLSVVEFENQVETREVPFRKPAVLHVETDMAFGGFTHRNANRHTVRWETDKSYTTQVNYRLETPCVLKVQPTFGPDQTIENGEAFESFRLFEMVYDTTERERRGLALRRLYRTVAPWVTENPLMLHCRSSDTAVVKRAIDQCAECGFEMLILSFGSGFNSENDDPAYLSHWKEINDYAMSKGIHMGSYSLYSSRSGGHGNDIVPPEGMGNAHGRCPAITSPWGQSYIKKLYNLFEKTDFLVFENDGPYPGDVDITPRPPLQKGVNDSRWVHWKTWTAFYQSLRGRGVYMNLPDYYYLAGANKCGMGYREVNWSLPREQQRIHTRQNIYDGTWEKTPSMGWMFVPLTQYHGGGAAATIEPLSQHLEHYEIMLRSNLGMGVQACYRGPRLYDTEETKQMVTGVVKWFKAHRDILESDMIHGRRADGVDIDWMLHVNPRLREKAFLSAYNPTGRELTKTISVPLYYSGLRDTATISDSGGKPTRLTLGSDARTDLTLAIPAYGYRWYVFE